MIFLADRFFRDRDMDLEPCLDLVESQNKEHEKARKLRRARPAEEPFSALQISPSTQAIAFVLRLATPYSRSRRNSMDLIRDSLDPDAT